MSANDKTEKATPKKREDARKKGQVARSMDANGAAVMFAGVLVLGATAPGIAAAAADFLRLCLASAAGHDPVTGGGLGTLMTAGGSAVLSAVAPVALACLVAGLAINVVQVGFKPTATPLKPDLKKLNPLKGMKTIFGPKALFETGKSITKVAAVGAIVAAAILPQMPELASLIGTPANEVAARMSDAVMDIAMRAAVAYLVIAVIDYAWQRRTHEKQLRMDHQEVKEEMRQQNSPAEVRMAVRRRQHEMARRRMMAAVPEADVVVTNPTHYSVALRYDGSKDAPEVVAKGKDTVALRIREIAREHGVPIVPDPPLARALHADVEVGETIPAELFQAVAAVLAFVYRLAATRRRPADHHGARA